MGFRIFRKIFRTLLARKRRRAKRARKSLVPSNDKQPMSVSRLEIAYPSLAPFPLGRFVFCISLSAVWTILLRLRRPRWRARPNLYCKSIYQSHSDGITLRADYKFKCKPTWPWGKNEQPFSAPFSLVFSSLSRGKSSSMASFRWGKRLSSNYGLLIPRCCSNAKSGIEILWVVVEVAVCNDDSCTREYKIFLKIYSSKATWNTKLYMCTPFMKKYWEWTEWLANSWTVSKIEPVVRNKISRTGWNENEADV